MSPFAQTRTADIGIAALEDLLQHLPLEQLAAGDTLVRQGDVSDFACYLISGSVAVFAESDYERVQLAALEAPRLIGELGVLAAFPRTATIEATTPIAFYRLTAQQLIDVGRAAPEFLLSVISQLGRQVAGMNSALSLYSNALSALERREFDARILDDLAHPSPQLVTFANAFKRFAVEIVDKRRKDDELASAALIQRSFLPRKDVLQDVTDIVDLSASMRPARDVGGDFYDYFMLDERRLAIAIGDVCGKGIPASLFMAVSISTLRSVALEERNVATTVARTNAILCRDNEANMFATLFYAVLDLETGELEYANCGHNAPYIVSPSGLQSLPTTGIPLGLIRGRAAAAVKVQLAKEDRLVLFTDGVTEAMNHAKDEFTNARFEALLRDPGSRTVPAADLVTAIFTAVDAFAAGEEQTDDITCLALRLRG